MSRQTSTRSRQVTGLLVALVVVAAGVVPSVAQTTATAAGSDPAAADPSTGPVSVPSNASSLTAASLSGPAGSSASSLSDATRRQVDGGSVTSEGVSAMNLTAVHEAGYTGEGSTVVVIDDGFDTSNPEISDQVVATRDFTGNGIGSGGSGTHGTAVAEIVADTAPDARLVLVRATTEDQMYDAVDYVRTETDADVVSLSRNWRRAGSLDGNSRLDDAISESVADGTTWFVSAGNSGDGKHWSGQWSDPDGDDWLNFEGSRETSGVVLPSPHNERHSDVSLTLQWDQWPRTSANYDLYLTNTTSMDCTADGQPTFCDEDIVASSTIPQQGNQEPWELISDHWVNAFSAASYETSEGPKFYVAVHAEDADGDARFDLFAGDNHRLTDDVTPEESLLVPAANADVITVGATGPQGQSVAPYSSRGPTVDGRQKPDLVAPAGVQTDSAGRFTGTSAAAPHAAGVAAVLLEADGSLSPAEIGGVLEENAAPVTGSEPNSVSGHGLVDAGASLAAVTAGDDSGTSTPTTAEPTTTTTAEPEPTTTATPEPTEEPTAEPTTSTTEPSTTTTSESPSPTSTTEPATSTTEPTSDESAPDESTPDESGPDESTPEATTEPNPDESEPDEPTSDESDPDESTQETTTEPNPDESAPDESTPGEPTTSTPEEPTPEATTEPNPDDAPDADEAESNDDGSDDDGVSGGGGGGSAGPGVSQDGGLGIRSVEAPDTATVGTATTVRATLSNTDVVGNTRTVEFSVDGTVVDERRVTLDSGEETTIRFTHTFQSAGDHRVSVGAREATIAVDSSADATSTEPTDAGDAPNAAASGDTATASEGGGAAVAAAEATEQASTTGDTSASRIPGFTAVTFLVSLVVGLLLLRRRQ